MQEIDLASWPRREHFELFRRADLPFYNINTQLDITGLKQRASERSIPINLLLIHMAVQAMNSVENFRYRLRGDSVVLHERVHASFTHLRPGEDLFRFIIMDVCEDLPSFADAARQAIAESDSYFGTPEQAQRDDLIYFSSLPWFTFTGIDHAMSLRKEDAIPRVTWGRFFEDRGRTLLPFNLNVNHVFIDGLHVGRFLEAMQSGIGDFVAGTGTGPASDK